MLLPWLDGEGVIEVWLGLLVLTVMALFYYGSNLHSNLADTFLLRVNARLRTDDTIELQIKNKDFATASRVTGTVGPAWLSSQPQLVMPGADAAKPQPTGASARYSLLDRLRIDSLIGPRIAPFSGMLISVGVLAVNHWYAVTEHKYYPIAVYVMPPLFFLGLGGMFNPSVFFAPASQDFYPLSRRHARIVLTTIGLIAAVILHGWLYQFSLEPTVPIQPRPDF
jgi:hypothetical protein